MHLFDDHPTLAPEIADILLGTGYRDLRCWTLLSHSYGEVLATGLWLLRNEGGPEIFLPLVVGARLGRAKSRKKDAPEAGTGSAGSTDGPGESSGGADEG